MINPPHSNNPNQPNNLNNSDNPNNLDKNQPNNPNNPDKNQPNNPNNPDKNQPNNPDHNNDQSDNHQRYHRYKSELQKKKEDLQYQIDIIAYQKQLDNIKQYSKLKNQRDELKLQLDISNHQVDLSHHLFNSDRKAIQAKLDIRKLDTKCKYEPILTELYQEKEIQRLQQDISIYKLQHEKDTLRVQQDISELKNNSKKRKLFNQINFIDLQLNLNHKSQELKQWTTKKPTYPLNPIKKLDQITELTISDRRIHLCGAIIYSTADHITDRIDYYNHQNHKLPIFIIIDYSPGGSVMAGYRILKSIETSKAPIYVVVKSFAASMAASITSLAPNSLIYPNAIMLHHQIWSHGRGNLTQYKEQYENLVEWWTRLETPLVDKINQRNNSNLTLNDWIKLMYEHNSDGDWEEFGDNAVKLGWVDQVVHRITETSRSQHPDFSKRPKLDHQSNQLPELLPFDYYWLYDPHHHYDY